MEKHTEPQENLGGSIWKQNFDRSMTLLMQKYNYVPLKTPWLFLGCWRHTFGEGQHFKTQEEFESFAKFWNAEQEIVKP